MDTLIHEKSYLRIAKSLGQRCPSARAVVWHDDGTLRVNGEVVTPTDVSLKTAWISTDAFGSGKMDEFADAMIDLGPIQWAQTINAGLDMPVYQRLGEHGINISKSDSQSIPIAEYVLAYALQHAQDLKFRASAQAEKAWKRHRFAELWKANWLIVGYGHIGRNVAKRAKGFDSHITVVRRTQSTDEYIDKIAPPSDLFEHLPKADFVVLACPATRETRNMANAEFFSHMKPGALLVNIARGSLVDEDALLMALEEDRPAHAVLDVFAEEPLPEDSPLWSHPKVSVTAHISNAGHGFVGRSDELFLSNLERFIAGEEPLDVVSAVALANPE